MVRLLFIAGAVFAALLSATAAPAAERGLALDGAAWVSGGIGQEEVQALERERERFSLAVRTAARGSGEYLADVDLLILDGGGRALFHQHLAGPWFLVDLRPGNYTLYASWHGDLQTRAISVPAQGRRDVVFYFRAEDF
jgi:hypothetical protein